MDIKVSIISLKKIDLKKVSDYIGTRNVGQVRSHLQKHLIKEKKTKDKNNIISPEKIDNKAKDNNMLCNEENKTQ